MKKKVSPKELKELRRKEQARKELEFQIGRDLKIESERMDNEDRFFEDKNRFVIALINFFGTLMAGYILKFIMGFFIPFAGIFSGVFNVLIWGAAIVSAFRRRSLLDEFF